MKKLVLAEKPSVARDIARVLKCDKKGEGFLYNDDYVITWAIGHLVTLYDPEDYDASLKRWSKATLPIIPDEIKLKPVKNTKAQLDIIKKLMLSDKIDSLICATDSGREGELIFRYIYKLLECKKPFERLWISSMTDAAIKAGFASLKPGSDYDNLYLSAKCRSEADWLVGINASRAFTLRYNALLSIGRVQTPTLAIIVQRQKEIDEFKVEPYWEIEADFSEYKGTWISDKQKADTKIPTKEKAKEIVDKCKGKPAYVDDVQKEDKTRPAPLLYDLTELQRDSNDKYGFSAQKTLNLVQALYEKYKMVTYPRTDSRYLSDDMIPKIPGILRRLSTVENYKKWCDYILSLPKLPISKRIVDNSKISDHHAIIPTEANPRIGALSPDELKVYELIARRFMQVFFPVYSYSVTKIYTLSEGEYFLTKGTTVKALGWTELNVVVNEKKKKNVEVILPDVKKNDSFTVKAIKALEKKTKPPTLYNESGLLSAMENAGRFIEDEALKEQLKESGLGTPATRAGIIERLIQVKYIQRKGKSLVPTEKGVKLIEVVMPELKSPETTGKWEKALTSVAKGKLGPEKFMASIIRYVNYIIDRYDKMNPGVVFAPETRGKGKAKPATPSLGTCPACGGTIHSNTKAYYCSNWQNGCKFTVWKSDRTHPDIEITDDIIKEILEKGFVETNGKKISLEDKGLKGVKYE